jgi:hypothetical protein
LPDGNAQVKRPSMMTPQAMPRHQRSRRSTVRMMYQLLCSLL